jgi:DNA polymerase-3 subunit delta'
MVCHSPGRLLATIRSRCRRLAFHPLDLEEAAAFVRGRTDANPEEALRLAHLAQGAPGRALALYAANALSLDDAARELLGGLPQVDPARVLSLADGFRGGEGAAQFALLFDLLAERVHALVADRARQGIGGLDRWAAAWETLQRLPREAEALNLDRTDALFTAVAELRQAAQA